ncbi:hypothetical protein ACTXJ9_07695 [Brachybacterium tyrofermentans]|uniref:hypothetical protein n=1 Tax=Brachybacterium tyrofermentans TaxID=47848 RepID=UPI003FD5C117
MFVSSSVTWRPEPLTSWSKHVDVGALNFLDGVVHGFGGDHDRDHHRALLTDAVLPLDGLRDEVGLSAAWCPRSVSPPPVDIRPFADKGVVAECEGGRVGAEIDVEVS